MKKIVTIFSLVIFVALIGVTQATTIDPTTSKVYDSNVDRADDVNINKASNNDQNDAEVYDLAIKDYITVNPITLDMRGGAILWDLTHGVTYGYEPSAGYSDLTAYLDGLDFTMNTTTGGLDNEDLSQYDIIVIGLGSSWNSPYTSDEVAAVETFVNNGGGLLILGDNSDCPLDNINPIAGAFGMIFGNYLYPLDLYISDFEDHPIFDGITEIYYRAAGDIAIAGSAEWVAYYESYGVAAVNEVGSGRVVALSDLNCFANDWYGNSQNQAFSGNVFNWLSTPAEADILWDITHGVYMNSYSPEYNYNIMLSLIEPYGHGIVTTDAGVENIDLSSYDVLVVSWGTAYDEAYTSGEVAAIEDFVENGGGLLVMGDNPACPNVNINPVSQAYGVTCGISSINANITDLEEHDVFDGVSEIYFVAGGEITVNAPSMPIASSSGLHAVSAYSDGNGKVIVIGDANLFQDNYITEADNEDFSVNLFNWLAEDLTGIEDIKSIIPMEYLLSQNYPNPFNAQTIIKYNLPEASQVNIEIFDLLGRKVASLVDEKQTSGIHQVIWNADNAPSGMYFYRLQAGDKIETKSMTLLK